MFGEVRVTFHGLIYAHPWAQQLAGILPLSSLIDFLDVPRTLHIFQLTAAVPFWCWPITPAGSRLLLSDDNFENGCCLDQFGTSPTPVCLDGRYGDSYNMASPETLRLCLKTCKVTTISNDHENMSRADKRLQNLDVVSISRVARPNPPKRSIRFIAASLFGWILFGGFIALGIIMQCYLTLAFLTVVLLTGLTTFLVHGAQPRRMRVEDGSSYNRLVVAAMHMNETDWKVFYGESSIVNSLLNWPLRSQRRAKDIDWLLRVGLRFLIIGQWACAIGAAALQGWDSYLITFWVVFCTFSQTYLFSPERNAKDWLGRSAELKIERYHVQLSSRRALLNTIMALNPDTFCLDSMTKRDTDDFHAGALRWIDLILKAGPDRKKWEEATRLAMIDMRSAAQGYFSEGEKKWTSRMGGWGWRVTYGDFYWARFILEGIEVATRICQEANLTGRFVEEIKVF